MPRAVRFAIEVPVRFRALGQLEWLSGQSVNISRSGVLFRADQILLPETHVELILPLPVKLLGESGAQVVCSGDVVRTLATAGRPTTLAATIAEFRFVRAEAGR
jgi:PilZ domain-containing protein